MARNNPFGLDAAKFIACLFWHWYLVSMKVNTQTRPTRSASLPCLMLVDDHALFRTGLRMLLTASDRVGKIVVEAGSINEALAYSGARADVVLLDIQMPGLSGLDGVTVFKKHLPKVPIIILSAQADTITIGQAKLLGAAGFVPKAAAAEEIFRALEAVLAGKTYYFENGAIAPAHSANIKASAEHPPLTARQLEVLEKLCLGLSNKRIAGQLGMTENTVRVHVAAILDSLGAGNRSQALLKAQALGMIR